MFEKPKIVPKIQERLAWNISLAPLVVAAADQAAKSGFNQEYFYLFHAIFIVIDLYSGLEDESAHILKDNGGSDRSEKEKVLFYLKYILYAALLVYVAFSASTIFDDPAHESQSQNNQEIAQEILSGLTSTHSPSLSTLATMPELSAVIDTGYAPPSLDTEAIWQPSGDFPRGKAMPTYWYTTLAGGFSSNNGQMVQVPITTNFVNIDVNALNERLNRAEYSFSRKALISIRPENNIILIPLTPGWQISAIDFDAGDVRLEEADGLLARAIIADNSAGQGWLKVTYSQVSGLSIDSAVAERNFSLDITPEQRERILDLIDQYVGQNATTEEVLNYLQTELLYSVGPIISEILEKEELDDYIEALFRVDQAMCSIANTGLVIASSVIEEENLDANPIYYASGWRDANSDGTLNALEAHAYGFSLVKQNDDTYRPQIVDGTPITLADDPTTKEFIDALANQNTQTAEDFADLAEEIINEFEDQKDKPIDYIRIIGISILILVILLKSNTVAAKLKQSIEMLLRLLLKLRYKIKSKFISENNTHNSIEIRNDQNTETIALSKELLRRAILRANLEVTIQHRADDLFTFWSSGSLNFAKAHEFNSRTSYEVPRDLSEVVSILKSWRRDAQDQSSLTWNAAIESALLMVNTHGNKEN